MFRIYNDGPRHYFGGGGGTSQVVREVAPSAAAPTPTPPTTGEAAHNVKSYGIAKARRPAGRSGTLLAPQGTIEDQVKNLLGM